MKRFRKHVIDADIWNTKVVVMVGFDERAIRKEFASAELPADTVEDWVSRCRDRVECGGALTMFTADAPWYIWVFFPKLLRHSAFFGAVAHEMLHATCFILRRKGVLHTFETEEAYTYTLEHLVRSFFDWARVS